MRKTLMQFATFFSVLALLSISPAALAGKDEPIYVPDPINVPNGKSAEDVKQVIRKALFKRGWDIKEVGAGNIEGTYTKSGRHGARHTATVGFRFDSKTIRMEYRDSQDLDYNKADGTIHKTYNRWVRNIEKDVRSALGSY